MTAKEKIDQVFDSVASIRETLTKLATDVAVVQSTLNGLKDGHAELHHRMFEGNGQPAIIPELHTRLAVVEKQLLPTEKLRSMIGEVVETSLDTHTVKCQASMQDKWNGVERRHGGDAAEIVASATRTRHPFAWCWISTMVAACFLFAFLIVKTVV